MFRPRRNIPRPAANQVEAAEEEQEGDPTDQETTIEHLLGNNRRYTSNPVSTVNVDFKILVPRVINILFEQREIVKRELFQVLERQYKNGDFYRFLRRLDKGKGYNRVLDVLRVLKKLGVLDKRGTCNEDQLLVLIENQRLIDRNVLRQAINENRSSRYWCDNVTLVYDIYHTEYAKFFGPDEDQEDEALENRLLAKKAQE